MLRGNDGMNHNRKNNNVSISKTNGLFLLLVIVVIINLFLFSKIIRTTIPLAAYPKEKVKTEQQKAPAKSEPAHKKEPDKSQLKKGFQYSAVSTADINSGDLILVNADHKYIFSNTPTVVSPEELVSVYSHKTASYKVKDINVQLNLSIIDSLNKMMDEFKKATGNTSVMIVSAFRGEEEQQTVLESKISQYGEADGKQIASQPGCSEHHSGYAFDFTLLNDKGKTAEYDGTGDCKWIAENCYKYGFILRYPDGKTDITGIKYEPWHFRYVGNPHAKYIFDHQLTLEEYITLLKKYTYNGESLSASDSDGQNYEIYSVPVDAKDPKIVVPKDAEYTLSGNNIDGIIVTVKR